MVYDSLFGPWGRIIIVALVASFIVLALLLIACFLTPGCIGYECTRKHGIAKQSKTSMGEIGEKTEIWKNKGTKDMRLHDVSYRSWRLGSLYDTGTIGEANESRRKAFDEVASHRGSNDTVSSTANLIRADARKMEASEKPQQSKRAESEFLPELTMSLQYLPSFDGGAVGKLIIGIEALSNLPPKQYNCSLEPYVVLNIVKPKQTWSRGNHQKLHSFKTRGIRHTASPIYRESFVVADAKLREIKEWSLDIVVHDFDKYANHTELCSLKVPLKDAKKMLASPEIHMVNYHMKPSHQEFGNILLGISYLPTAQRLSVNVVKLRNLKFTPAVSSVEVFNPYVKVLMLNGKTGKSIKKKKTRWLRSNAQPEFNETLTFDLSYEQLDNVQFLVVLCSKISPDEGNVATIGNGERVSDSEDSINNSLQRIRDVFIGKVALGKGVKGSAERLHWFSVLQNPRKFVNVWHVLK